MPPYPADLERWWLSSGHEALVQLLDMETIGFRPRECGFSQAAQTRLLRFDGDQHLEYKLRTQLPRIRALIGSDYGANPRKSLAEASRSIFRKPEDGGMDHSMALEGLGLLDAVETHRLRLLAATKKKAGPHASLDYHLNVIHALHQTASGRYAQFHMGFRTCV